MHKLRVNFVMSLRSFRTEGCILLQASCCVWLILIGSLVEGGREHSRTKRYLVFPRGGSFKIVIGIGIPVKLGTMQSMAIGWNFQAQYMLPQNITQLQSYPPVVGRRKRDGEKNDRELFYTALEKILDSEGYNGRQCIVQGICDTALATFHHDENGLYGELLHILFSPNYGYDDTTPDIDAVYLDAQQAGRYGVDCKTLFPDCNMRRSFLDLFSVLGNAVSV
ncbi:unnamed protein product [Acanthoscelides obtectus]|uniref:Uncharacterized protein n=1 Tax=Acanthoscelides obtectus TaxID=200917 RepID=A0A9P0KMR4_ACAOB|nr:unnamed protein product [Acanthoscelides obtectus]CAK1665423.1 hypothetical protein AOBTE_LOCUS24808 [Acanthoscelides obtectus]